MRKGLVVTLGVALVLSVVPAFSEAPIISCIPDIVISDLELGQQTADSNLFVFEDALDLDEFVRDLDTAEDALRWSFIETGAQTITINGITSVDPANVKDPGAKNIRTGNGLIDLENTAMGATSPSAQTTLQFYVSDGDKVSSQSVVVRTVNVGANATSQSQDDALVSQVVKDYGFDTNEQGWIFNAIDVPGLLVAPAHKWEGGALVLTENPGHGPVIVYGSYETPKAPTEAVRPKIGCVHRGRYTVKSSGAASDVATPGFRLHAVTKHVVQVNGQWTPDFKSTDFIDEGYVQYMTSNFVGQVRVPGAAGQDFFLLYYPNQVAETLLSTSTITYFTFELLDTEAGTDAGTLSLDKLVIDAIDNPAENAGTAVAGLTTTTFTTALWEAGAVTQINIVPSEPSNISGLVHGAQNNDLVITVAPGNRWFEAFIFNKNSVKLTPGNYYRVTWDLSATVSGTFVEPRVRLAAVSDYFIWLAVKEQQGGAAVAGLTQDSQKWVMWFVAPSADPKAPTSGLTEGVKLRFGSWQGSAVEFPVTTSVGGTVRAASVTTEEFNPIP